MAEVRWRKLSPAGYRSYFLHTVKKGDILICNSRTLSGIIGHAALMVSKDSVLEMPGGQTGSTIFSLSSSNESIVDNNRLISARTWYSEHQSDYITTVYRCQDDSAAVMAADWAYTHYYNPSGGKEKTIHIRYSINSPEFEDRDPSYCSKLVLQAYYYGTGSKEVISDARLLLRYASGGAIIPADIPAYFTNRLTIEGVF